MPTFIVETQVTYKKSYVVDAVSKDEAIMSIMQEEPQTYDSVTDGFKEEKLVSVVERTPKY